MCIPGFQLGENTIIISWYISIDNNPYCGIYEFKSQGTNEVWRLRYFIFHLFIYLLLLLLLLLFFSYLQNFKEDPGVHRNESKR